MSTKKTKPESRVVSNNDSDTVWGFAVIGQVINRTAEQTRYLHKIGALKGAVRKLGHRTAVGSRAKLQALGSSGL
jgi:hypothetical protein